MELLTYLQLYIPFKTCQHILMRGKDAQVLCSYRTPQKHVCTHVT